MRREAQQRSYCPWRPRGASLCQPICGAFKRLCKLGHARPSRRGSLAGLAASERPLLVCAACAKARQNRRDVLEKGREKIRATGRGVFPRCVCNTIIPLTLSRTSRRVANADPAQAGRGRPSRHWVFPGLFPRKRLRCAPNSRTETKGVQRKGSFTAGRSEQRVPLPSGGGTRPPYRGG